MCRILVPVDGTHCPRCGLRVAALPRRPKAGLAQDSERPPSRRRLAGTPRVAALQGAGAGVVLAVVITAAGLLAAAFGGPGRALVGDGLLACAGLLVLTGAAMPGVHISRWADPEVLKARTAAAHRVDPRRAAVLGAAAVCALGLVIAAVAP